MSLSTAQEEKFQREMDDCRIFVHRFSCRLTGGDRELADDVTQEAFINAYKAYDRFKYKSSFRSWVCRIVMRKFMDEAKKAASRPKCASYDAPITTEDGRLQQEIMDKADGPEALVLGGLKKQRIETAISMLPRERADIFTMFYMDGLSYEEISEALGIPIGTAKSRVSRAADMFRDRYRQYDQILAADMHPANVNSKAPKPAKPDPAPPPRLEITTKDLLTPPPDVKEWKLTPRELEVLLLVSLHNKDIADILRRSVGTVKNQIANILKKSGACSRTELAILYCGGNNPDISHRRFEPVIELLKIGMSPTNIARIIYYAECDSLGIEHPPREKECEKNIPCILDKIVYPIIRKLHAKGEFLEIPIPPPANSHSVTQPLDKQAARLQP